HASQVLFTRSLPTVSLQSDGLKALTEHINAHTPVLITDLAAAWPALTRWAPERLSAQHGNKTVRVYDASFGKPGRGYMGSVDTMPFSRFLDEVLTQGRDLRMFLYNIGRQIPELLDDIVFPDVGLRFSKRFVFTFFGCRGATTPLHYDIDMGHVLHTVIRGRRRVRLFPPSDSSALYRHPFTVRSYVNLESPDLTRYPAMVDASGWETTIEAGQTLFMPAGYWHEFHYLEAGVGLSLRAPSDRVGDKLAGLGNVLLRSPIDRLANKIASERWFNWKQRQAHRRGEALLQKRPAQ
ncbi:MAG: cupin-like domain-containing protein, partial [Pseudomonadota bacterium]